MSSSIASKPSALPMLKILIFSALMLTAAIFLWNAGAFYPHQVHRKEYHALLVHLDPENDEATPYSAKQQRTRVQKEIWFLKKGQPLKFCIQSAKSELILDHHDELTEVVEHMHDVKCFQQEELGDGNQTIRYMEAETADYYYQQEKLVAKNVKVLRYTLPGHELLLTLEGYKPLMKGHAESIEFIWKGNELRFSAEKLKATVQNDL